jgi:hypothetical protein
MAHTTTTLGNGKVVTHLIPSKLKTIPVPLSISDSLYIVTQSSNYVGSIDFQGTYASLSVDDSYGACTAESAGVKEWIEFEFPQELPLSKISLRGAGGLIGPAIVDAWRWLDNCVLEYWNGSAWVFLSNMPKGVSEIDTFRDNLAEYLFTTVSTSKVRIYRYYQTNRRIALSYIKFE